MSRENVERLRAVYADWSKGDFHSMGFFAPAVSFEPMAEGREALPRDAIESYMREFLAQWAEFRVEGEKFVEVGDTILVTERQRGTGKRSGVETEQTSYATWTFRDGRVVRVRWDVDRASALKAAGLLES